ncbi:MAG: class I SAM-dependent methyltransferase, partial [Acidimicrobiia bacterium]
MAAAWDGDEGQDWARDWRYYDRAVREHHRVLLHAAGIAESERVLDIGCGTGQATRDAARAARGGSALGVDLSSPMLARAAELAAAEGLTNVEFARADAQVHPFAAAAYDVAISRFGAMFFGDPIAAFTNIAAALRPGGGLAMVTWRGLEANEWLRGVIDALAVGRDLPGPPAGRPGPLGLAVPELTGAWLQAAGFEAVAHAPVDAEVCV